MGNIRNNQINFVQIDLFDYENNSYFTANPKLFEQLAILLNGHASYSIFKTLQMECNRDIKDLMIQLTPNLPLNRSLNERLYWILHDLHDFPTCSTPNCINNHPKLDKLVYFKGFTNGYQMHCCNRCAQFDPNTTLHKKETTFDRHGNPNYRNPEKTKLTYIKHYGVDHPMKSKIYQEQLIKQHLDEFGAEWYIQTNDFKDKTIKTLQEHYGGNIINSFQAEPVKCKIKETWIDKYGVDNPSKDSKIKVQKIESMKKTSLEKYGVEWPIQNPDVFSKTKRKYVYENIQFDSYPEIAYYIWLKDNNINFEYQPKITFNYEVNGKQHFYHPDFLLIDTNEIVEIKSSNVFENGKMINLYDRQYDDISEAKHQCMLKNNVKIIKTEEYLQYIEYVEQKFGKDFQEKCRKHLINSK